MSNAMPIIGNPPGAAAGLDARSVSNDSEIAVKWQRFALS
jgi:hypothetical protein